MTRLEQLCEEFFGTKEPQEIRTLIHGLAFDEVQRKALRDWCKIRGRVLVSREEFHMLCWRAKIQVIDDSDPTAVVVKDFGDAAG